MYCKYCGKETKEGSTFCDLCGKNIIEHVRSDDNQYISKDGIIYITQKPKNSYESWLYNALINNGGRI